MKVFFSWSGQKSRKLGEVFRKFLPDFLPGIEIFFSPEDIDKGTIWFNEIAKTLDEYSAGILFLTTTNLAAPWLMFEAGALFKHYDKSRVCPVLFELSTANLEGPLEHLNVTLFNNDDIERLLLVLNKGLEKPINATVIHNNLSRAWTVFEEEINAVLIQEGLGAEPQLPVRSDRELLEEIVNQSRRTSESITSIDLSLSNSAEASELEFLTRFFPRAEDKSKVTTEMIQVIFPLLRYKTLQNVSNKDIVSGIKTIESAQLTCSHGTILISTQTLQQYKDLHNSSTASSLARGINRVLQFNNPDTALSIRVTPPPPPTGFADDEDDEFGELSNPFAE